MNKSIDYTQLDHTLPSKDIKKFVQTAIDKKYRAVVVPYTCTMIAKKLTKNTGVKVATVYGFPFDKYNDDIVTQQSVSYDELDVVIPVQLYYYNYPPFMQEIEDFLMNIRKQLPNHTIKLIIETQLMRAKDMQIKELCEMAERAQVDVIKTSTGLIKRKPEEFQELVNDIKTIKKYWKGDIKASGGIRTKEQIDTLLRAGATIIGTSTEI